MKKLILLLALTGCSGDKFTTSEDIMSDNNENENLGGAPSNEKPTNTPSGGANEASGGAAENSGGSNDATGGTTEGTGGDMERQEGETEVILSGVPFVVPLEGSVYSVTVEELTSPNVEFTPNDRTVTINGEKVGSSGHFILYEAGDYIIEISAGQYEYKFTFPPK